MAAGAGAVCVAHRGDWREVPENSIEAVLSAWKLGVTVVEVDVRQLGDETLVLHHDADLEGRPLRDLNAATFHHGSGAEKRRELADLLALPESKGWIILDLKQADDLFLKALTRCLNERPEGGAGIILQSHSLAFLKKLEWSFPEMPRYYVTSLEREGVTSRAPSAEALARELQQHNVQGITAKGRRFVDQAFIRAFKQKGIRYLVWTINESDRIRHYRSLGVDGIITDRCDLFLSLASSQ